MNTIFLMQMGNPAMRELIAHSTRTALYTFYLATELTGKTRGAPGHDRCDPQLLALAALFHDIGKLVVPENILEKPQRLTSEEFRIIQTHTVAGAAMISRTMVNVPLAAKQTMEDICRFHHERWDGSGYPEGRKGEEIPFGARIVAICDAYDAMVHDRAYSRARSHESARAIISEGRGALFDSYLADVFLSLPSRLLMICPA
ncbi:HD-GYP domain-containing protein [Paraburkholderia sp. BR10936]|uniref:HD domain-containing phosphohydrolase n=1 Tax=Paraburkholderia guartelaensis TaxID=2546446 RepID=A0ABU9S8E7_9BURK